MTKDLLGAARLRTPLLNRGTAFTPSERRALGLEALLPAGVSDQRQQAARAYSAIAEAASPLARYRELMALQDRNEYLFYRVLLDHLTELMPIVYTPTVGEAAQRYGDVFQRGRGLWLTPQHRGRIREVIQSAVGDRPVRLLVVTDNEAILGLGDQGAGGMTISIGKLALYTAAAGIAPEATLPISLDVGTNNERLQQDEGYLGWRAPRLSGAEYDAFVAEFVEAVADLLPQALVQWEDFRKDNALAILDRYREAVPSFNDDIQGTGAVTVAGIFSAMRKKDASLAEQRILVFGAGAAGLGIARQVKAALLQLGVPAERLDRHVGLLDSRGLLVDDQPIRDDYKKELAWRATSASELGLEDPARRGLLEVVAAFAPTVLIGSSGQGGAFTEAIVRQMHAACAEPVIMPLSNPTSAAEARPEDLLKWTDGSAIVATGSPFDPIRYGERTHRFGQGNNVFIFPGLGLAALLAGSRVVTDAMITSAARALADEVTQDELASGLLYPDIERLREVTARVAARVLETIGGVAAGDPYTFVKEAMWTPTYPPLT